MSALSALDDLFDGHYFTEDPHVYIPIDEAWNELVDLRTRIAELRAENARLQKAVEEAEAMLISQGFASDFIPLDSSETSLYCNVCLSYGFHETDCSLGNWLKEYGKSE